MKKQNTYRLREESDRWLTEESKSLGISKNDIIQLLVNMAMANGGIQALSKPPKSAKALFPGQLDINSLFSEKRTRFKII